MLSRHFGVRVMGAWLLNQEFIRHIATHLWLINFILWRCHAFWHARRDIGIAYILAIVRSSIFDRVGSISSGWARVMSYWICAKVFTSIFVFQVKLLDLCLLEEIPAFQTFWDWANFLGLSPRYILSCQIKTPASWAILVVRRIRCILTLVLIAISDQMRCTHHVVFDLHQLWWRLVPPHLLVFLRYHHLSLLVILIWHLAFHMHWLLCDWLAFWRRFLFLRCPVFIVIWALNNVGLVLDAHVHVGIHVSVVVLHDLFARPERLWLVRQSCGRVLMRGLLHHLLAKMCQWSIVLVVLCQAHF